MGLEPFIQPSHCRHGDAPSLRGVSDESQITHVLVRVWLPDRPGALGLVASRIGAIGGDIIGIDVLERGGEIAVDEFAVELATSTCSS